MKEILEAGVFVFGAYQLGEMEVTKGLPGSLLLALKRSAPEV